MHLNVYASKPRSFTGLLAGYSLAGAFSATSLGRLEWTRDDAPRIGVCNAYIADITHEEERPVRMAHVNGSIALGVMTGPVVGGLISTQGFTAACSSSSTPQTYVLACRRGVRPSRGLQLCIYVLLLGRSSWKQSVSQGLGTPNLRAEAIEATEEDGERPRIPGLAWLLRLGERVLHERPCNEAHDSDLGT